MLKNHPKGLLVAFFANMGERFGFYTMMAILVLFLQAKYGLAAEKAGDIYSWFYFAIYALALVGGILADSTRKYKTVILFGIIIMFAGYILMAVPGMSLTFVVIALFTIAFGNGLFKGNLQAVVGQMYDDPKYSKLRDSAFMIFYMGINIGAFFAPYAANGIRNWWLKTNGFAHDGSLPALCHQFTGGQMTDPAIVQEFQTLADKVSMAGPVTDLGAFAESYLNVFSRGYNYAFGIAAAAMVISLLVYVSFNKLLPNKEKPVKASADSANTLEFEIRPLIYSIIAMAIFAFGLQFIVGWASGLAFGLFAGFVTWILTTAKKDEYARVSSLILVFVVVIFFWMSFHQNGLTLTLFARDYTVKQVGPFTNLFFNLPSMLAVIGSIAGLVMLLRRNMSGTTKIIGGALFVVAMVAAYLFVIKADAMNAIEPEVFQSFNPLFIVTLTFPVMGLFAWLNKKGIEPSTPKKIGIGMLIASVGFVVVLIASVKLPSPASLGGSPVAEALRVTPYWLISSYLILTVAELFLSPMGLSFVSKVAPSRFQGLMQAGWLLATAVGNKLLFVGTKLWDKVELWQLWTVFIVCCLLSAAFIFSIMKRLENATK
ncbi:MAG TPA: peptide MFS transporter [Bacteroidales bacterium]|jgi:POT family proton-dependent oligopeptide transporter|nr:peptide MFS transporter [Bacteroidales bacterium]MDI9533572.1 peptide MFS transporter [Bacteroidota bacterium]MBP8708577.1 peptide MFS transporter [Bacteroidales bacterium]HHU99176.1 peptide MFS transporter [Bacteroidales bacterium]HNY56737.1 peptide MFS transporter [Bacteroidales bacterium]